MSCSNGGMRLNLMSVTESYKARKQFQLMLMFGYTKQYTMYEYNSLQRYLRLILNPLEGIFVFKANCVNSTYCDKLEVTSFQQACQVPNSKRNSSLI